MQCRCVGVWRYCQGQVLMDILGIRRFVNLVSVSQGGGREGGREGRGKGLGWFGCVRGG